MPVHSLHRDELAEQKVQKLVQRGMEGPHWIGFEQNLELCHDLFLYNLKKLGAVVDHFLRELEAVVAHL